jgi:hypothetical protein
MNRFKVIYPKFRSDKQKVRILGFQAQEQQFESDLDLYFAVFYYDAFDININKLKNLQTLLKHSQQQNHLEIEVGGSCLSLFTRDPST